MDDKSMFDVLKPFMPMWCQKVLPAVFDQSLSYYELLCKILQKYNELVAIVNAHSEKLENHETRIVTLETITKEIQQKLAELDEAVKQNTANIAALTERVNQHDEDIEAIQAFITGLANSTTQHGFTITQDRSTIKFYTGTTAGNVLSYADALSTLIRRGSQVMRGYFEYGSQIICSFYTGGSSSTADRIFGFGVALENGDLHYVKFHADPNVNDAKSGIIANWKSTEVLDITDIMQSEGTEEYKTISQKVITDLLKKKLASDMGITGATAGQYLNIATVDSDGKPLTYGFGTPGGGGSGVDIVQTTGQSTTSVMSQKAVTDNLINIESAINNLTLTVIYPSTVGGTDGRFVTAERETLTREALLRYAFSRPGINKIFTVQKSGATSLDWQRITWFKSSAGEGLYDFAWYETDGTNAKAGVDRLTMATSGLFAVSEEWSTNLGGGETLYGLKAISGTATLDTGTLPGTSSSGTAQRTITISIPMSGVNSLSEARAKLATFDICKIRLSALTRLKSATQEELTYIDNVELAISNISDANNVLYPMVNGAIGFPKSFRTLTESNWETVVYVIYGVPTAYANGILTITGKMKTSGGSELINFK